MVAWVPSDLDGYHSAHAASKVFASSPRNLLVAPGLIWPDTVACAFTASYPPLLSPHPHYRARRLSPDNAHFVMSRSRMENKIMTLYLSQKRWGRMCLHLMAALRAGHWGWHLAGIRREVKSIWLQPQMVLALANDWPQPIIRQKAKRI